MKLLLLLLTIILFINKGVSLRCYTCYQCKQIEHFTTRELCKPNQICATLVVQLNITDTGESNYLLRRYCAFEDENVTEQFENNSFNIPVQVVKYHMETCWYHLCNAQYLSDRAVKGRISESSSLKESYFSNGLLYLIFLIINSYKC